MRHRQSQNLIIDKLTQVQYSDCSCVNVLRQDPDSRMWHIQIDADGVERKTWGTLNWHYCRLPHSSECKYFSEIQ